MMLRQSEWLPKEMAEDVKEFKENYKIGIMLRQALAEVDNKKEIRASVDIDYKEGAPPHRLKTGGGEFIEQEIIVRISEVNDLNCEVKTCPLCKKQQGNLPCPICHNKDFVIVSDTPFDVISTGIYKKIKEARG